MPTSSLSTGLLARSFHALVALASTDAPATVSKGPAHSPLSGRVGECASPFLRNRAWTDLDHGNRGMDRGDSLLMPCQAWFIVGPSNYIQVPKFSRLRTSEHAKLPIQVGSSGRSAGRQAGRPASRYLPSWPVSRQDGRFRREVSTCPVLHHTVCGPWEHLGTWRASAALYTFSPKRVQVREWVALQVNEDVTLLPPLAQPSRLNPTA